MDKADIQVNTTVDSLIPHPKITNIPTQTQRALENQRFLSLKTNLPSQAYGLLGSSPVNYFTSRQISEKKGHLLFQTQLLEHTLLPCEE